MMAVNSLLSSSAPVTTFELGPQHFPLILSKKGTISYHGKQIEIFLYSALIMSA